MQSASVEKIYVSVVDLCPWDAKWLRAWVCNDATESTLGEQSG